MNQRRSRSAFVVVSCLLAGCEVISGLEDRKLADSTEAGTAPIDATVSDAPMCGSGAAKCGDKCRDLQVDSTNCGACGHVCAVGTVCSAGRCDVTCQPGVALCAPRDAGGGDASMPDGGPIAAGSYCANLKSDNLNCGGCAVSCKAGEACISGLCGLTCQQGLSVCSVAALDAGPLDAGLFDAGPLDASLDAGSLDAGGLGSTYCANLQSDDINCGACGVTCGVGLHCTAGGCATGCGALATCPSPDGGALICADTKSDSNHCGGCGKACTVTQFCANKTCLSKTVIYSIALAQLDNLPSNCGGGSYYASANTAFGFHWLDTGGGTVKTLSIQVNYGVDCAAATMPITLNGMNISTVASVGNYCTCTPRINVVNVLTNNVAPYKVGGNNALLFTMPISNQGLASNANWGAAFAQVTVTYQ